MVRTHPVSGRQALFVNEGFTTRIVDRRRKSDALLNFLFAHITKPEFQVRWRWQENDVAIWDNRVTQHYANADYLPQRRIMHRATILGIGLLQGLRLRLRKPALTVPAVPVHPAGHFRLFQRGFGPLAFGSRSTRLAADVVQCGIRQLFLHRRQFGAQFFHLLFQLGDLLAQRLGLRTELRFAAF